MADNTTLNSGSGGDVIVNKEVTHSGDTAKLQSVSIMGVTGSEGSYTVADINGDATNGLDVDVTRVQGTVTISGTVTADAGTNLNTSALAVESGGNLDTLAGAVSGTEMQVDILTQPAADRTTDNIGAALQTDVLMDDTTVLTPKFAVIDEAASGDNTIVAAVAGKKIRVLAYTLIAAGAVNVRWESGAAGTALSGQMNLTTNSGMSPPFCPLGHFETAANTLLNLELSGAVSVDGHLTYVEV